MTAQIAFSLDVSPSKYSIVSSLDRIFVYRGNVGGNRRWFTNGSNPMIVGQSIVNKNIEFHRRVASSKISNFIDINIIF